MVADLKGLLAAARQPGALNYGVGRQRHLAPPGGRAVQDADADLITHIPYRGAGPALQDLIAGQVDLMFDGLGSSAQHIRSGRIKALAVAGTKRAPGFPDIPTAAEAGVPGYEVATWYGLWAPKGTPRELVVAMQAELRKALPMKTCADLDRPWDRATESLWRGFRPVRGGRDAALGRGRQGPAHDWIESTP